MSFNATRLTCFALISSLESDCRDSIIASEAEGALRWPVPVRESAEQRAKRARADHSGNIEVLVQYLDFADAYQILLGNKSIVRNSIYDSLKSVSRQLEGLSQVRNRVAHSRPMEIGDLSSVTDIANELVRVAPDDFNEFTIDVRDKSHAPAAKLLRSALRQINSGNYDVALENCGQAATLAPSYSEVWRVQGMANIYRNDLGSAEHDFRRAYDYAETSAVMVYHYSSFLQENLGDSDSALSVLQKGLRANQENPMLLWQLGRVYFAKEKYHETIGACSILASLPQLLVPAGEYALLCLRAGVFGAEGHLWNGNPGAAIEFLEEVSTTLDKIGSSELNEVAADWLLHLSQVSIRLQTEIVEDLYLVRRAGEFASSFQQRVRVIDPGLLVRCTAQIARLDRVKLFGFLHEGPDRFFHRNDLISREEWQLLQEEGLVAFDPISGERGPRAERLRPLA